MIDRATTRLARLAVGLLAAVGAGTVLTACGASAGDLARASCTHVNASIRLLGQAAHTPDATRADALRAKAYLQLLEAIPIAAQAAYHDIEWQALSTTLSEANRVPEEELIPSLQTQCQAADSSPFGQAPPPTTASGG